MSHRHEQIESTLKRAVQQVLARGLSDPRADGAMITLTDLKLGADLKIATILLSVYPESKEKLVMHAVRHAASHVRRLASDLVALKQMPDLVFSLDKDLKKHAAILDAFAKVNAEREARGLPPAATPDPDPAAVDPGLPHEEGHP